MGESQTWRVVLVSGEVREVVVYRDDFDSPYSVSTHRWCAGGMRSRTAHGAVVSAMSLGDEPVREILAPGEPTRGELAAQLAAVTAERDVALEECSTLRRGLDHADGVIDHTRASLGAADDEGASVAAQRVTRELAVLRAQQAPLVACVDALRAAARDAGWRDADATGERLVTQVRRGEREACAVRCDAIYTERDDAARKRRKYGTQNTCDGDCARLAGQAQGAAMCVEAIREGGE